MRTADVVQYAASYGRQHLGYGPPGTDRFIRCMLCDVGGYDDVSIVVTPGVVTITIQGQRRWWWPLTAGMRTRAEIRRVASILDPFRSAGVEYRYEVE
jgi:hypothetical protein